MADEHTSFRMQRALDNKLRKQAGEDGSTTERLPQKDKSIQLVKTHEFQFFDNLEGLQTLAQQIRKMIDNFEVVPEDMKDRYHAMLATGFAEWTLPDYKQFFRAFRKRDINDLEGIASEIESKSTEEVAAYLRVFGQRFHELKEKDQIILKLQQKDFETQNLQTIQEFDHEKAKKGGYVVLLQTNDYFNKNGYLALISKAQQKLNQQNKDRAILFGDAR